MPGAKFVSRCMEKGAIINCTHDTVLRFVPPLIAGRSEVDKMVGILGGVFEGGPMKRDLISVRDLSADEIFGLIGKARKDEGRACRRRP